MAINFGAPRKYESSCISIPSCRTFSPYNHKYTEDGLFGVELAVLTADATFANRRAWSSFNYTHIDDTYSDAARNGEICT